MLWIPNTRSQEVTTCVLCSTAQHQCHRRFTNHHHRRHNMGFTSCLFVRRSFIVWCRSKGIYYKWNCRCDGECENMKRPLQTNLKTWNGVYKNRDEWIFEKYWMSKNREEVKTDKFVLTNLYFLQNAVLYITVNNREIGDFVQELRLIHFCKIILTPKNWPSCRPFICVLPATLLIDSPARFPDFLIINLLLIFVFSPNVIFIPCFVPSPWSSLPVSWWWWFY